MAMPIDLVLVRHGESEGNVANRLSRKGDNKHFTEEFLQRHSSSWRLTDRGISQAKAASKWIKGGNFAGLSLFDRYYTSEYVRAKETAGYLDLFEAAWFKEFYLRERDWGDLDVRPDDVRNELFSEALKKREAEPFFWTPPNGEPLADLCLRVDRVIHTLHRECAGKRVIIVCHGETMWAFRVRLERMSQERFKELHISEHPYDHIHNCQILHYTRRNPETGSVNDYLNWMRSICPWDLKLCSQHWQEIVRSRYSNEDLLAEVSQVKRMVNNQSEAVQ